MDRVMLYQIIYALAACNGREKALFGSCAPRAREAFVQSLVGTGFPELWFELPFLGEPWFDLHVLAAREDLGVGIAYDEAPCGGVPEVFRWFGSQGMDARQLALSWDTSFPELVQPAVQLLRRTRDTQLTCDFLAAAGRSDAESAYRAFEARLPEGWFACYTGVFPQRREPFLRVECIPPRDQQRAYAADPALLADHLRQVGLADLGDTLVERCQVLADTPFQLEFQFDVTPEGTAGSTFSASVRFAAPSDEGEGTPFDADGAGGTLMKQVEAWGLADDRWRQMAETGFSKRVKMRDNSCLLWCFPAFLKLRWRAGEPVDAKAYLIAGAQDFTA